MKFITTSRTHLLCVLLTTIITITIFPTLAHTHPHIQPRSLPGAYYTCTSPRFAGPTGCTWTAPTTRCRLQGSGSSGGIKSLGPDPGTLCTLYTTPDCTGMDVGRLRFPGLGEGLPVFGSFACGVEGGGEAKVAGDVAGDVAGEKTALLGVKVEGDVRLAGGVGSAYRRVHAVAIGRMEEDGFREGVIGLDKGMYY